MSERDAWNDRWNLMSNLDSKDSANRSTIPPRVVPNPAPVGSSVALLWGMLALGLLGLAEGTLAWIALGWAADLGWLDERPDWWPVTAIAIAIILIRAFDKSVFRR